MSPAKKFSTADWKSRKVHDVTLPSGAKVKITIPSLPALLKVGRISNDLLIQAAEIEASTATPTVEQVMEQYEFVKTLVAITVVEPEITEADVDDIPVQDQEMLVQFAMRQLQFDAVYHQLGGLETVGSFREAHNL